MAGEGGKSARPGQRKLRLHGSLGSGGAAEPPAPVRGMQSSPNTSERHTRRASFLLLGPALIVRRARARKGRGGRTAHFHWWRLRRRIRPPPSPHPLGVRTSGGSGRGGLGGGGGQDGGAFEDSERLGSSPQVNSSLGQGHTRRGVDVVLASSRVMPRPGYL